MAKKELKAVQVGNDWYSVAQDREVEEYMELEPGREPNSTTKRTADRREEYAM